MKVTQLLSLHGPRRCQVCRDTDCLCGRSYGHIRVFFRASCSWRSEGLFGQSFSITLLVQAHRVPPHPIPLAGVLLCSSVHQAFHGPVSPLFSCWHVGREAMVMAPLPMHNSAVLPCFHNSPAFLHKNFPTSVSSLTSPRSISLQSTAALTLGLLHNP